MPGTRDRIVTAMTEIARDRGFYGVSMEEVALRAGVSKRTIYRHFTGKEELVQAVMLRFLQEVAGQVEEIIKSDLELDAIFIGIANTISRQRLMMSTPAMQDLQLHYPHIWKLVEEFRAERIKRVLHMVLNRNQGKTRREVDPRIITAAFTGAIQAVLNPDFILNQGLNFEEAASQVLKLLIYGMVKEI